MNEKYDIITLKIKPGLFPLLFSFLYAISIVYLLKEYNITNIFSDIFLNSNHTLQTIIAAPVIEEILKSLGYLSLFFLNINKIQTYFNFPKNYKSQEQFIQKNILWMGIFISAIFGLLEGILYTIIKGNPADEIIAHTITHIMFTITPILYFKTFKKKIFYLIPIAIIMHILSNLRYIYSTTLPIIHPVVIVIVTLLFIYPILIWFINFHHTYKGKKIQIN